ncbi:hypothetical protein [Hymenobacter elongatus]|uniref:Uncharacterized protein n=1 Tax=Hymenobacter elongatus TaxID=877208 RepID=A0A4Z0PQJ1_9BACT|nr:hypothetical protein [Hymenobacter elongatus]TGE18671.1 hypothetical protein E5J99_05035 [Hymenobacter elongatus]
MLNELTTLRRLTLQLIKQLHAWELESPGTGRTPRALERMDTVLRTLRIILSLGGKLAEMVPGSSLEAQQECPMFWYQLETEIVSLHKRDSQLDGVVVEIQKAGIGTKASCNYARICVTSPLEDLLV